MYRGKTPFPPFPLTGKQKLSAGLKVLFEKYGIEVEYYK